MDEWGVIETPEVDPHLYELTFDKGAKVIH